MKGDILGHFDFSKSFQKKSICGIAKCQLFSQANRHKNYLN